MTTHILDSKELSRELGVPELDLQHLAHSRRLPFSFSSAYGFFCHRKDLPQWRAAMEPAAARDACCGD